MADRYIPESELIIINGRVYHLNLEPDMVADTIIVVGDPDRVPKVSQYFDEVELKVASRELVTHTGYLNGKRLTVMSSGMGTDNVELLMTELDALVNVDFKTRKIREKIRALDIIRIGTSGCLHPEIPLDAHLMSTAALGLDTLMHFYEWEPDEVADEVTTQMQIELTLPFQPYFARASEKLLKLFEGDFLEGVTITAPGFYAPQGRAVRLKPREADLLESLGNTNTPLGRFTNFEMETAGYYAMGSLLGHRMLSVNALIANRATQKFSDNHHKAVDDLIRKVLGRIA